MPGRAVAVGMNVGVGVLVADTGGFVVAVALGVTVAVGVKVGVAGGGLTTVGVLVGVSVGVAVGVSVGGVAAQFSAQLTAAAKIVQPAPVKL